jgi:hypothetical protein
MYWPYPISGYVDLHGGWDGGRYSGVENCCEPNHYTWNGGVFGGAGRVAVGLSPSMSAQADVWTNVYTGSGSGNQDGPYNFGYTNTYSGIAGHLSWRTEGQLIGVLASYGNEADTGTLGTVGAEAVYNLSNLRFYGQIGVSSGLSGSVADDSARDWYARGVTAYYLTPNFALSANLGYDTWSDNSHGGTTINSPIWGARLEYKPDSMPVSGFVAYAGRNWSGSNQNSGRWSIAENAVIVGIRVLYDSNGKTTLRQLGEGVGLSDVNPSYGDPFVH